MKILFAVSNENISASIKKQYQDNYKGMLTTKNVYYFNAIIKELQNDKTYDVVIISEDLEPFANNNYEAIDKFLIGKLTDIREESKNVDGTNIPIIFIMTDRHTPGDNLLCRLYEISIYNALFGENRSIHKVCELISKPRDKEMAKRDYKIVNDSQQEDNDDNVKESEIKNIIAHYKKLGKSEEKYVESFDNIASQYSDAQLKVIIRFLPLNVKAVLEEQSSKYQELMTFGQNYKKTTPVPKQIGKIKEQERKLEQKTDVLLEQLSDMKSDSQIIIPKAINPNVAQKIDKQETTRKVAPKVVQQQVTPELEAETIEEISEEPVEQSTILPGFEDLEETTTPVIEPVKKGRGRPKKAKPVEDVTNAVPKKRGRPKKVQPAEIEQEATNLFDLGTQQESILPGLEEEQEDEPLEMYTPFATPDLEQDTEEINNEPYEKEDQREFTRPVSREVTKSNYSEYNYQNIEHLISKDRKIVSFVGTSKNGTSFIVNNMAQVLSTMNINTAILDMTKNRNSYYIYTQNDENLRQRAHESIGKLREGMAEGIIVNKNLTVYTATPTDNDRYEEADLILKTLIQNYALVLIDCDFDTPFGYFDNSQEIYLVQSMDILTIQPLTAFLRDLKSRDILKQEKIRVIINKEQKVRGLNEKVVVGGIAYYNDPSMSFMTELFDKNKVKTCVIPFDLQVYARYLGTLVDCDLSLNGYPKQFLNHLKQLANMIYPLLSSNNKNSYTPPSLNKFQTTPFTNDMDNTLIQMKNRY